MGSRSQGKMLGALFLLPVLLLSACGSETEDMSATDLNLANPTVVEEEPSTPAVPLPGTNGLLPSTLGGTEGTSGTTSNTMSSDVTIGVNPSGQPQYDWQNISITQQSDGRPIVVVSPAFMPAQEVTQRTLIPAEGETPMITNSTDLLVVKYEAVRASNGKIVGSSWATDKTSTFSLDSAAAGWTPALSGMRVGERRIVTIPGELTTGKAGSGLPQVKKGETLVAIVDLVASIASAPRPETSTPPPAPQPTPNTTPNITPTPTPSPTPSPTPTFIPVPLNLMGLQLSVANIISSAEPGNTSWPRTEFNSLRIWDPQTTWAALEPTKGEYQWTALDNLLAQAKLNGVRDITLVVGGTPEWAARGEAPTSAAWIGTNSASPPLNQSDWVDFLSALSQRYKGQINAYQLFNAPNDNAYFTGTPSELANLVKVGGRAIKKNDPKAKIVSPGFAFNDTVKPATGERWFKALKREKWPVDIVAYQLTPSPVKGVDGFVSDSRKILSLIEDEGWNKDIWLTDVTYVDRSGRAPTAQKQRELVARTYWAARDLGIQTAYWYMWGLPAAPTNGWWYLLLQNDSAGALGYDDAYQAGR